MIPFGDDQGRIRIVFVTIALVVGILGVYVWLWALAPEALLDVTGHLGIRVDEVLCQFQAGGDPREKSVRDFFAMGVLPLLSHPFVHSGPIHAATSVFGLWVFGSRLESRACWWRFLAFFLIASLVSGVAQVVFDAGADALHVGASGPVGALAITYFILYPKARVRFLLLPLPLLASLPGAVTVLVFGMLQFHKVQDFAGLRCGVSLDYVPLCVVVGVCGVVVGPLLLGPRARPNRA